MLQISTASFGLVFSQPVLSRLSSGCEPRRCVPIVQRNAMIAWHEERSFRDLLVGDPEVRAVLDDARLDACFRPEAVTGQCRRTFDELDRIEAAPLPTRDG